MKWTKQHSKNAVAAKATSRIVRAHSEVETGAPVKVVSPRTPAADFIITIKSKRGERLQVSAWRFNGQVIFSDGTKSVRQLCRGLEHLITKSA